MRLLPILFVNDNPIAAVLVLLTGIVNCFHPELYRFTSFLSRKDIFQDVNRACHHLRAEFREQMIVTGILHAFRRPDIAAQQLIADTGAV